MFLVIGQNDQPVISEEYAADKYNLGHNVAVIDVLEPYEYCHERAQLEAVTELDQDAEIIILTHAGFMDDGETPWIAGLSFEDFASVLVKKFPDGELSDRTIWFLCCLVGGKVGTMAQELSNKGVRGTTLYMPDDFMFISTGGIPHNFADEAFDKVEAANATVLEFSASYKAMKAKTRVLPTGELWHGARIDDAGGVAPIADARTKAAVIAKFDPGNSEN